MMLTPAATMFPFGWEMFWAISFQYKPGDILFQQAGIDFTV
jgi:hypothetical protein